MYIIIQKLTVADAYGWTDRREKNDDIMYKTSIFLSRYVTIKTNLVVSKNIKLIKTADKPILY